MLQHIVKWAVLATAWRQVRPYLVGTLIAILAVLIVDTLHAEFLAYLKIRSDLVKFDTSVENLSPWLMASFFAKWASFLAILIGWLFYLKSRRRRLRKIPRARDASGTSAKLLKTQNSHTPEAVKKAIVDDKAFDFLRTKSHLRTRGEILLDNKND